MSTTKRYRQTPTGDLYTMEFQDNPDGTIRIVSHECPADHHGKGVSEHHRYSSGEICVSQGKEPRTLDRAEAIAAAWIDGWSEYVRTGTFPKKARAYNV